MEAPLDPYRKFNRLGTVSEKWNKIDPPVNEQPEPFVLSFADMDFVLSEDVKAGLVQELSKPNLSVGYAQGDQQWKDTVAGWIREESGCQINKDLLTECAGIFQFVSVCADLFVGEGQAYVVLTPLCDVMVYHGIYDKKKIIESRLLLKEGKFEINYEQLEELMARKDVKMFLFVNPHSPTGKVWTQEEVEKVVAIMEKTGKMLVSDQIYSSFAYKPHTTLLKYANRLKDNLIVCNSPTKCFNVSGSACGYGIMPNKKLLLEYEDMEMFKYTSFPTFFSVITLKACYLHGKNWLKATKQYIQQNIELLVNTFKQKYPKITVFVPEAGYAILFDLEKYGLTSEEILAILRKYNIVISSMKCFFSPHAETPLFRVTVGCNRQYLERFLVRLEAAFVDIDQASKRIANTG